MSAVVFVSLDRNEIKCKIERSKVAHYYYCGSKTMNCYGFFLFYCVSWRLYFLFARRVRQKEKMFSFPFIPRFDSWTAGKDPLHFSTSHFHLFNYLILFGHFQPSSRGLSRLTFDICLIFPFFFGAFLYSDRLFKDVFRVAFDFYRIELFEQKRRFYVVIFAKWDANWLYDNDI